MSLRDSFKQHRPELRQFEWNGTKFWVRSMSGADRADYRERAEKAKSNGGFKNEYAFALAVRNEDGLRVYDVDSHDDVDEISALDGSFIDFVVMRWLECSGLTRKAVEDAEKNLDATQN